MKNFIAIVVLLFFVSCTDSKKENSLKKDSQYVISQDNINKEDTIYLSSYFKGVKTIILETNPDCLIGIINNIKVLDNYIVVTDRTKTKNVFVFNKNGKFLHRIGNKGGGPGEYTDIKDTSIDNEKKEIYIFDSRANKINKYDIATGKFINSIKINNKNYIDYFINHTNDKMYSSVIPTINSDNSYLLQEIDANTGKHLSYYLNSTDYNRGWNDLFSRDDNFFYPNYNGDAKFVQMFMNTVFSISDKGVEPYLEFKVKNWITEQDVKTLIEYKDKNNGAMSNEILFDKNLSFNIHRFFESQNTIFFQYQNHGEIEFVIFDKIKQTARIAYVLVDNLIYSEGKAMNAPFAYADQNGIYSYLKNDHIPQFLESLNSEEVTLSLDKRDSLKYLKEESNPVIFYYEFKN